MRLFLLLTSLLYVKGQNGLGPATSVLATPQQLLSNNVAGINEVIAGILNFGNDIGRKVFPPDAYTFAEFAGRGSLFESVPIPLSETEKTRLQGIIDECPVNPQKATATNFVTVQDNKFNLGGATFQFLGFNSYQVIREQLANPAIIDTLFSRAKNLGLKVTRVWLFSDELRTGPFDWDERIFVAIDNIMAKAAQYDIKIVFAFANYWEHFTGSEQYVFWSQGTLSGKTIEDFFLDYGTRLLYKAHVCKCVNRVNTVTGVRWRDDPVIMSWNLMNEPRCPGCTFGGSRSFATTEWTKEMAQFIKSIDPNHLVTSGMEGFSTDESGNGHLDNPGSWALCQGTDFIAGHNISEIDYATIHVYPEHKTWDWPSSQFCDAQCQINWSQQYYENRITEATSILKKPLVLEEFGMSIKMRYRVSMSDGSFFERDYSRDERYAMYQRLLGTMLSAVGRGERADGLMFWMAITNSYPDYDGFSIELDDSVTFEGQVPPDYNVLLQFRKQKDVEACVAEKSSWIPNVINPKSLTTTVTGRDINELLFQASEKLGGVVSSPGCGDVAPDNVYTCAQQKEFGKCQEAWMTSSNFCQQTCGRCPAPAPASPSTDCTDVAPSGQFSCAQQKEFGKCSENWMTNGDFCKQTCGRCTTTPAPTPAPTPTTTPAETPSDGETCVDTPPDSVYSCQQQKDFGKCRVNWMVFGDYCSITCGRCLPQGCTDIAPDSTFTCQQQSEFGKCGESWMTTGGFCAQTCQRC